MSKFTTPILVTLLLLVVFGAVIAAALVFDKAYIAVNTQHEVTVQLTTAQQCGLFNAQIDQIRDDKYLETPRQSQWDTCNQGALLSRRTARRGDYIGGIFESLSRSMTGEFSCIIKVDGVRQDEDKQVGFPQIANCGVRIE